MTGQLPAFAITARHAPSQGPRVIQLPFDFSTAAQFVGDIYLSIENGGIDFIQSVKIDNSDNAEQFILNLPGIGTEGDRIVAAPYTSGTYPIFVPPGKLEYIAASAGNVLVVVSLFNIELPYSVSTVLSAMQPTPPPAIVTGTAVDGALALTGASQVAFAANANRVRATIQNPPNNANSIWVKQVGAATATTASQEVPPGAQFDTGAGPLSLGAINVIGTNGQSVYIVEISA